MLEQGVQSIELPGGDGLRLRPLQAIHLGEHGGSVAPLAAEVEQVVRAVERAVEAHRATVAPRRRTPPRNPSTAPRSRPCSAKSQTPSA